MKRYENGPGGTRALAVMLSLVLGIAAAGGAAEPGPGAPADGIKVHGHWTIEVRNPDGSLVSHHEFENALMAAGAVNLARFLGRVNSPGLWTVLLLSLADPPLSPYSIISENRHSDPTGGDLTVSVPTSGPNRDKLVLSGSFTSPDARSIFRVNCDVTLCATGSPACQPGTLTGNFSVRELGSMIPVQAGQIVQVAVVFSFS
jgi:hypothetical protein